MSNWFAPLLLAAALTACSTSDESLPTPTSTWALYGDSLHSIREVDPEWFDIMYKGKWVEVIVSVDQIYAGNIYSFEEIFQHETRIPRTTVVQGLPEDVLASTEKNHQYVFTCKVGNYIRGTGDYRTGFLYMDDCFTPNGILDEIICIGCGSGHP